MGRISVADGYYTLVNMFTVRPEDQRRMYDEIVDVTGVIRRFPGFVSANVHLSEDGTRVVNYAQWRSRDPIDALGERLRAEGRLTDESLAAMEEEIAARIGAAVEQATAEPEEPVEDLTRFVYSESSTAATPGGAR